MVVQVFVAERNAVHALGYERLKAVLHLLLVAPVHETGRRLSGQSDPAIGLPQQQLARIRGDGAAIERGCDLAAPKAFKFQLTRATLLASAVAPKSAQVFGTKITFADSLQPVRFTCEISGLGRLLFNFGNTEIIGVCS